MKSPTLLFLILQSALLLPQTLAAADHTADHTPPNHRPAQINHDHEISMEDAAKLHYRQDQQHPTVTKKSPTSDTTGTSFVYLPHKVAQEGNLKDLKVLLHDYPALLTDRDNNGWTLMHEAARGGHVPIAEYLISIGADKNAQALDGYTPLYEAQKYHGPASPISKYLTSQGAVYETPKQRLRGKQEEIVKNFAHSLAGRGKLEKLKSYVKAHGNEFLKAPDSNGWTLLHEAARFGQLEMAVYLVEQGLHVNSKTKDGTTAMQLATQFQGERSAMARLLQSMNAH